MFMLRIRFDTFCTVAVIASSALRDARHGCAAREGECSVQEIDKLITELQTLRDTLHSKGARVQREIVQYSTLTTAALQSTKIMAESLTQLKKAPDAPTLPDLKDRSVAS